MSALFRLNDATDKLDGRKSTLRGKPRLGHHHGIKPDGQSPGRSKRMGLDPKKQACWGKTWVEVQEMATSLGAVPGGGNPGWTNPGWSNFFPRSKNNFSVGAKGQETPPGTIFENRKPISIIFNNTCSKMTNYHVTGLKYKCR
jgi:hypothetical protein